VTWATVRRRNVSKAGETIGPSGLRSPVAVATPIFTKSLAETAVQESGAQLVSHYRILEKIDSTSVSGRATTRSNIGLFPRNGAGFRKASN
jgi:hypothetical protein